MLNREHSKKLPTLQKMLDRYFPNDEVEGEGAEHGGLSDPGLSSQEVLKLLVEKMNAAGEPFEIRTAIVTEFKGFTQSITETKVGDDKHERFRKQSLNSSLQPLISILQEGMPLNIRPRSASVSVSSDLHTEVPSKLLIRQNGVDVSRHSHNQPR